MRVALLVALFAPVPAFACEQNVVLSEHLAVDGAKDYYLVTIQLEQEGLADAGCRLDALAGETWLLRARSSGGAMKVSPFDSRNVPEGHERFATYVRDIEAAVTP